MGPAVPLHTADSPPLELELEPLEALEPLEPLELELELELEPLEELEALERDPELALDTAVLPELLLLPPAPLLLAVPDVCALHVSFWQTVKSSAPVSALQLAPTAIETSPSGHHASIRENGRIPSRRSS